MICIDIPGASSLRLEHLVGAKRTACVGNGRNDALMMGAAVLGIVVVQAEGATGQTLQAADVIAREIVDALGLLLNPQRLVATLRV
jgi:soluble P-type ATPase